MSRCALAVGVQGARYDLFLFQWHWTWYQLVKMLLSSWMCHILDTGIHGIWPPTPPPTPRDGNHFFGEGGIEICFNSRRGGGLQITLFRWTGGCGITISEVVVYSVYEPWGNSGDCGAYKRETPRLCGDPVTKISGRGGGSFSIDVNGLWGGGEKWRIFTGTAHSRILPLNNNLHSSSSM